jgi:hypothetical protein
MVVATKYLTTKIELKKMILPIPYAIKKFEIMCPRNQLYCIELSNYKVLYINTCDLVFEVETDIK